MKFKPEILLHPNIPKPLHGLAPRTILGVEWWDKKRYEAYDKYNDCCWACGVHKMDAIDKQWLEGHEFYDIDYSGGCLELKEVVALCHYCHNYIHSGRMKMMVRSGNMTPEKESAIIKHGENILRKAGHKYFRPESPKESASWSKYHFLIEGKKYYSKFKHYDDWYAFYNKGK